MRNAILPSRCTCLSFILIALGIWTGMFLLCWSDALWPWDQVGRHRCLAESVSCWIRVFGSCGFQGSRTYRTSSPQASAISSGSWGTESLNPTSQVTLLHRCRGRNGCWAIWLLPRCSFPHLAGLLLMKFHLCLPNALLPWSCCVEHDVCSCFLM